MGTIAITKSWAGFYGDITGEIVLDDANNNTFYNWTLSSFSGSGEIFATREVSPNWTGIQCVSAAVITSENTYLDATGDDDSIDNTYFKNTHPAIEVAGVPLSGCNSTNVYTNGVQDGNRFWQILLDDGSSNIVYSTIIDSGQTAFNGDTHDFQLLVGENNNFSSPGTTAYYIWVELS
jgi:hypothetical protein